MPDAAEAHGGQDPPAARRTFVNSRSDTLSREGRVNRSNPVPLHGSSFTEQALPVDVADAIHGHAAPIGADAPQVSA